jgi:DNA sulfur modification protein DndD
MKIHLIELMNFRQFYGTQTIHFSVDDEKNITLIHGENGGGKTALLNAILWCFFEKTTPKFKSPKLLMNNVAVSENASAIQVRIEFEEDGEMYSILRRRTESNHSIAFSVKSIVGNNYEDISGEPAVFVNSIIPKDMAEYFFFHGEGIGASPNQSKKSVGRDDHGNKIRQAVRDILGFRVAEEALEDLKKAKSTYRAELKKVDKGHEISRIEAEIADLEERIGTDETDLQKNRNILEKYVQDFELADEKLANSNHEAVKIKHSQRIQLENSKKTRENELADALRKKTRLIRDYAISAFAQKLASDGLDFIDESELKGKLPEPLNVQVVKDIVDAAECLCGAPIIPGTEAFDKIQKLTENAADPALLNRIHKARSQLTVVQEKQKTANEDLAENFRLCEQKGQEIKGLTQRIDALNLEIDDVDFEEINDLNAKRKGADTNKNETSRRIGRLEELVQGNQKKLKSCESERDKKSHLGKDVERFTKLIDATKEIEEVIKETLTETEKMVRINLVNKMNSFLSQFVRQDYRANVLQDTYELKFYDRDGGLVPPSDGQEMLLSLTFISALLEIARERRKLSSNILTAGAVAPFVVDAPFGELDKSYKGNVAKVIPESVGQVIFLLSSSHWEGSVEENIRDRVGAEYNLLVDVAAPQGEKEAPNTIDIGGDKFHSARYEAEFDQTVIQEVGHYV